MSKSQSTDATERFGKQLVSDVETPKDPTINVLGIVDAAVTRLDDILNLETKRLDDLRFSESNRINEILSLRAEHYKELAVAESKRIDAIRAVDVNAVAVATDRATDQASVLANQVSASAETLRSLVASTATTTATQLATLTNQLTDRIGLLEKAQYEGKGLINTIPSTFVDRITQLEESRYKNEGRSGLSTSLLLTLASLGGGVAVYIITHLLPK